MAVGSILTILQGAYAYLQGADASQGVKPHVLATDWTQFQRKYAFAFMPAAGSASTDLENPIFTVTPNYAGGIVVFGCWFTPSAALTGDPSNNAIFQLGYRPAAGGGSQTAIGSTLTTTASWVAVSQVVLYSSAVGVAVPQNQNITINRTHGGTGVVNPTLMVTLEYAEV